MIWTLRTLFLALAGGACGWVLSGWTAAKIGFFVGLGAPALLVIFGGACEWYARRGASKEQP